MKQKTHFLALLFLGLLFISSCKKDDTGSLSVLFRDSGAAHSFDEVVVDVRRVEIKFANANLNNEFGKYFLDAHAGEFDFAALKTDGDREVANKKRMAAEFFNEMRIVAGDNNYVKINGVKYAMAVSNAPNSGLTFAVDEKIIAGRENEMILKIDIAASVQQSGGTYVFNPVITVE